MYSAPLILFCQTAQVYVVLTHYHVYEERKQNNLDLTHVKDRQEQTQDLLPRVLQCLEDRNTTESEFMGRSDERTTRLWHNENNNIEN